MGSPDERKASDASQMTARFARLRQELGKGRSLSRIVEEVPVPLALSHVSDGTILYANQCLGTVLGAAPEDLCGRDWSYVFPKLGDRRKLARQLARTGSVQGLQLPGRHHDGTPRWFAVWQQRVVTTGQECVLTILLDITDCKRHQRELAENRQTLQQVVALWDHDRKMLAHELHDGVMQEMAGALMHLEAAQRALERGEADAADQLQTVTRLLRDGIREARQLMDGARPPGLDEAGLLAALPTLVEKFAQTTGIAIEFVPQVTFTRLTPKWETSLYRIVQESLSNIRRHSRARRARVELTQQDDRLELVIRDWGRGFDPQHVNDKTLGLKGLQQRAQFLGGRAIIESAPRQGTCVRVEVPLPSEALVC